MDPDATLLIPNPGGRRAAQPAQPAPGAPGSCGSPAASASASATVELSGRGLNPLVHAANPLLDLIVPLRTMTVPPDLEALRQRLAVAIKTFETQARAAGVDAEATLAARYALCTVLDETIAGTPWGSGIWAHRSLLVAFHNEASGGEKFFLILQRLSQDVPRHLDLIELMYLCLALGLEGRYRVIERGPEQLTALRERLQQLIAQHRGAFEAELSPHWRGETVAAVASLRRVPVWVWAVVTGVLLLGLQLGFSTLLNGKSDPVFTGLRKVQVAPRAAAPAVPVAIVAPIAPTTAPIRVAGFLAPEVAQGLVSVKETADRSVITLRGDGVFGSGSAEVTRSFEPLLGRIGAALQPVPGKVIVIGHTDDSPPGLSARFPSNYDLSKARADGVLKLLAQRAPPVSRFSAEGRGDTEPLVPNDSKPQRSLNRRVDIVVLTPALPL